MGILVLAGIRLCAGEAPLRPVRVCEVLENLGAWEGKAIAIVGRFSFRQSGRFVSEEGCALKTQSSVMRVIFDPATAPKPPEKLEVDNTALHQELKEIKQHTSLGKIRFGSSEYDRWAVVYGRIEVRKDAESILTPAAAKQGAPAAAPVQLLCRGDGVVLFIADEE